MSRATPSPGARPQAESSTRRSPTWLEQRFAAAKRNMAEINKRQAFVIEGAEICPTIAAPRPASGSRNPARVVMLLPGPPHELKAMFERQCLPRLARIVPKQVIRTLFLRVAGMGETDLDQLIAPVYKKYENPVTTILAAAGDMQIHLRARCATEAEADALLAEVGGPIELLLGDRIYSRNGDPLRSGRRRTAAQVDATVSVAESATGGMLGERFTSAPAVRIFRGRLHHLHQRDEDGIARRPRRCWRKSARSARRRRRPWRSARAAAPGRPTRSPITGAAGPDPVTENRSQRHDGRRPRRCRRRHLRAAPISRRPPADPHLHRTVGTGLVAPPDNRTFVTTTRLRIGRFRQIFIGGHISHSGRHHQQCPQEFRRTGHWNIQPPAHRPQHKSE